MFQSTYLVAAIIPETLLFLFVNLINKMTQLAAKVSLTIHYKKLFFTATKRVTCQNDQESPEKMEYLYFFIHKHPTEAFVALFDNNHSIQ